MKSKLLLQKDFLEDKNKNPLGLLTVVYANLINIFHKFGRVNNKDVLPLEVGNYKRVEIYESKDKINTHLIGIYQNSKGKKALAKMWNGTFRDYDYFRLVNEANLYSILNKAISRVSKTKFKNMHEIGVPKLIAKYENDKSLLILMEYIDGKTAEDLSIEEKLDIYFQMISYLKYLGGLLTSEEKSYISTRSNLSYIFLYPILLLKAILTYPNLTKQFLKGLPLFTKSIPLILSSNESGLVSRDLHFGNILMSKNKIYLIDLEYCVFTNFFYELVITLNRVWGEDNFCIELIKSMKKEYKNNKHVETLFKGLAVIYVTHKLSANNFSKYYQDKFAEFLNFVVDDNSSLNKNRLINSSFEISKLR